MASASLTVCGSVCASVCGSVSGSESSEPHRAVAADFIKRKIRAQISDGLTQALERGLLALVAMHAKASVRSKARPDTLQRCESQ